MYSFFNLMFLSNIEDRLLHSENHSQLSVAFLSHPHCFNSYFNSSLFRCFISIDFLFQFYMHWFQPIIGNDYNLAFFMIISMIQTREIYDNVHVFHSSCAIEYFKLLFVSYVTRPTVVISKPLSLVYHLSQFQEKKKKKRSWRLEKSWSD